MLSVGGGEIILILLLALIILGPKQLPQLARKIGRGLGELRRLRDNMLDEINKTDYEPSPKAVENPKLAATEISKEPEGKK